MLTRSRVKPTVTLERLQICPGEELRGVLELVVTQKIDVTAVRIRISGKEESYIRKRGRHAKSHEFIYLDKVFTVFGFTKASGRKGGASLSPGTYSYPFHLKLPFSLPPTYFAQAKKARSAMRYRVEGIVDVPSGFDARVCRRFAVLPSAPRVQLTAAREAPAQLGSIHSTAKGGMFSKDGGFLDVALQVTPSVVRFASEPVKSDDDEDEDDDDDDEDSDADGEDDGSDNDNDESDMTGTTTGVSGSPLQTARGQGSPTQRTSTVPARPEGPDALVAATRTDAAGLYEPSRVPPPLYRTPDPARRLANPVLPSTPAATTTTPTAAMMTPDGNFPATVVRAHARPEPSADPAGPADVHIEIGGPVTPPAALPASLSDLFDFGHLQQQLPPPQQPQSGSPSAPDSAVPASMTASGSPAQPSSGLASAMRESTPQPAVESNLFGPATAATPGALHATPGRAPNPNAADAQLFHDAAACTPVCEVADFDDNSSEGSVEQPRTVPRGRRPSSFDASLRDDRLPEVPHPPAQWTGAVPVVPPRPAAVPASGQVSGAADGTRHLQTTRRQGRTTRRQGRNQSTVRNTLTLTNAGVSGGVLRPVDVAPPPLMCAASDAEMNVRVTITNGAKKRIKSVDVFLIEMTEIVVGHRLRCAQTVLAKFTCKLPKSAEKARSLVVDGVLCMPHDLRTRGKNGSRRLPLPTLFTSMCKTKTCIKVNTNGVKLQTPLVYTNVMHLVSGVDEANITVPGPLLFTTQHMLPEE